MDRFFEHITDHNGITFQLTDKPSVDEREIHPYHEILLYVGGNCELMTASERRRLKNGSLILIPRETYHFLDFQGASFTRLKITLPYDIPTVDMPEGLTVYEELSENTSHAYNRMCEIVRDNSDESGFAYAAFLMLMTELTLFDKDKIKNGQRVSDAMAELTKYVSENLSEELSVASLASRFHMSRSAVTHQFKREIGISIHKFIMQKRLILAKRLVSEGKQLSKEFSNLGFKDYSSLYKAYLRYFGHPPSYDKR